MEKNTITNGNKLTIFFVILILFLFNLITITIAEDDGYVDYIVGGKDEVKLKIVNKNIEVHEESKQKFPGEFKIDNEKITYTEKKDNEWFSYAVTPKSEKDKTAYEYIHHTYTDKDNNVIKEILDKDEKQIAKYIGQISGVDYYVDTKGNVYVWGDSGAEKIDNAVYDSNSDVLTIEDDYYTLNSDDGTFNYYMGLENPPEPIKVNGKIVAYYVTWEDENKKKKYRVYGTDGGVIIGESDTKPIPRTDKKGNLLGYEYYNKDDKTPYKFRTSEGNEINSVKPIEYMPDGSVISWEKEDGKTVTKWYTIEDGKIKSEETISGLTDETPLGNRYFIGEDGKRYVIGANGKPEEVSDWAWRSVRWGQFLDEATYITSGYRGLTFFYNEPKWLFGFYDETVMNILGGIEDGWSSLVCSSKISDTEESGIAMSESTTGAFAHIEGEKIKVINYSSEEPETYYLYKISFEVDPGPEIGGCDMEFKVYIQQPRRSVFRNSKTGGYYTFVLKKGNRSVAYIGANMIFKESKNNYQKVCIDFEKIAGGCLVGIGQDGELCADIIDGGEKSISLGEDPCDTFMHLHPICWFTGGEVEEEEEQEEEFEEEVGPW